MFEGEKLCVLAPHTDDGELGAGGVIHKYLSLFESVHYIAFSSCEESVPKGYAKDVLVKECLNATAKLGIPKKNVEFLDFKVRNFTKSRQDILDKMIEIRQRLNPTIVLVPSSFDVHQDHSIIYQEAKRAFKSITLLGYELPWNCSTFDYDLIVELSQKDLDAKNESISAYKSQSFRKYCSNETISSIARYHGLKTGCDLAEVFEVIRCVMK